jgi:hypothetical protein
MVIETEIYELPVHWATALMYGEEDSLDDDDLRAFDAFHKMMIETWGKCWCIDMSDESSFSKYHDARTFGVLACDVASYTFDITE